MTGFVANAMELLFKVKVRTMIIKQLGTTPHVIVGDIPLDMTGERLFDEVSERGLIIVTAKLEDTNVDFDVVKPIGDAIDLLRSAGHMQDWTTQIHTPSELPQMPVTPVELQPENLIKGCVVAFFRTRLDP